MKQARQGLWTTCPSSSCGAWGFRRRLRTTSTFRQRASRPCCEALQSVELRKVGPPRARAGTWLRCKELPGVVRRPPGLSLPRLVIGTRSCTHTVWHTAHRPAARSASRKSYGGQALCQRQRTIWHSARPVTPTVTPAPAPVRRRVVGSLPRPASGRRECGRSPPGGARGSASAGGGRPP